MRKSPVLIAIGLLVTLVLTLAVVACGEDPDGGPTTTPSPATTTAPAPPGPKVITIPAALRAEPGQVRVVGVLVATHPTDGTRPTTVLASALDESYPPRAGGDTIELANVDLEDLVGLSTTRGEPDVPQATWSNYWVVLEGTVADGVLDVQVVPDIIRAITPQVRIRFSAVGEPLVSGHTEWWAFDVRNDTDAPLDLTFSNGQRAEILLSQDGVEKYRWSENMHFTEAIETVTLQPGQMYPISLADSLDVAPGLYDVEVFVTAGISGEGGLVPLPAMEGRLQVY